MCDSEELEWELLEIFESGLFAFPVYEHNAARKIVRHLLYRGVLGEEIADAIEDTECDLQIWLNRGGKHMVGEWVISWVNGVREEFRRERRRARRLRKQRMLMKTHTPSIHTIAEQDEHDDNDDDGAEPGFFGEGFALPESDTDTKMPFTSSEDEDVVTNEVLIVTRDADGLTIERNVGSNVRFKEDGERVYSPPPSPRKNGKRFKPDTSDISEEASEPQRTSDNVDETNAEPITDRTLLLAADKDGEESSYDSGPIILPETDADNIKLIDMELIVIEDSVVVKEFREQSNICRINLGKVYTKDNYTCSQSKEEIQKETSKSEGEEREEGQASSREGSPIYCTIPGEGQSSTSEEENGGPRSYDSQISSDGYLIPCDADRQSDREISSDDTDISSEGTREGKTGKGTDETNRRGESCSWGKVPEEDDTDTSLERPNRTRPDRDDQRVPDVACDCQVQSQDTTTEEGSQTLQGAVTIQLCSRARPVSRNSNLGTLDVSSEFMNYSLPICPKCSCSLAYYSYKRKHSEGENSCNPSEFSLDELENIKQVQTPVPTEGGSSVHGHLSTYDSDEEDITIEIERAMSETLSENMSVNIDLDNLSQNDSLDLMETPPENRTRGWECRTYDDDYDDNSSGELIPSPVNYDLDGVTGSEAYCDVYFSDTSFRTMQYDFETLDKDGPGFIFIMTDSIHQCLPWSSDRRYKIASSRQPEKCLIEFRTRSIAIELIWQVRVNHHLKAVREVHSHLQMYNLHSNWFKCSLGTIVDTISKTAKKYKYKPTAEM